MKKVLNLLIVALFLLITVSIQAQFTRQQAINLVLNNVLSGNLNEIDVYASYNIFSSDAVLIDNGTAVNPHADSWVFFVDDHPFASWYHSSRYIFVSTTNGDYSILNKEIYPKDWHADFEEVYTANRPNPVQMVGESFTFDPNRSTSDYNYALIVATVDDERSWYNTSLIYNVLLQNYYYTKNNIIVLYNWDGNASISPYFNDLDGGDLSNDIDGSATWENIQNTIDQLALDLGHGDQLAIFFTGVPTQNVGPSVNWGFWDNHGDPYISMQSITEVSDYVEDIDCGQMLVMLDVNSSEDVAWFFESEYHPAALCKNRYIHGSTASLEYNFQELHLSGGDFSEQVFYWASAARGYLPDVHAHAPWNTWDGFGQLGIENGGGDYATHIIGHPGDNTLDDSGDEFAQMAEAFDYADNMNTWSDDGYCYVPFIGGVGGSPFQTPHEKDELPFLENLITLNGLSGTIDNNQSIPARSYLIADRLWIDNNISVSFANNTAVWINYNDEVKYLEGVLEAKGNSTLSFGENTLLTTNSSYNAVTLMFKGQSFSIGDNSTFDKVNFNIINGVSNLSLEYIDFLDNTILLSNCSNVDVDLCNFNNNIFRLLSPNGVSFKNSTFVEGAIHSTDQPIAPGSNMFYMYNCSFDGRPVVTQSQNILHLFGHEFNIENNSFINSQQGSVFMDNCGWASTNTFKNNVITNCNIGLNINNTKIALQNSNSFTNNTLSGLRVYNSNAFIGNDNVIKDNSQYGIEFTNNSQVIFMGNSFATYVHETQQVRDNGSYEIYTDEVSFPNIFARNAIIDEDDGIGEYLVYCFDCDILDTYTQDVRFNYWGTNLVPSEDFYPLNEYQWYPTFDLNDLSPPPPSAPQTMFMSAQANAEQGNYDIAQDEFKQVVEEYPESKFASASLKELYGIEALADQNYLELKQYLESDENISNDDILSKLGGFLANRCDIKLENYETAIAWYENIIADPPSYPEYLYAIIDLGFTYLLMEENNGKSSDFIGSMPEFKPANSSEHVKNANYYISLLPKGENNQLQNELFNLKAGELLQNVPNPFSFQTEIYYKIESEAYIVLKVFNALGEQVATFDEGNKTKGTHQINFNASDLNKGLYFYNLEINGKVSDTKKMLIN